MIIAEGGFQSNKTGLRISEGIGDFTFFEKQPFSYKLSFSS